ncbi:unnamed protein product [Calypogeia fissa]
MENVDMFNNATAQLTFHDFLDRMRHPSAADLVRSIKNFIGAFLNNPAEPERDSHSVQDFLTTTEDAFRAHPLWAGATDEEFESSGEGLEKYLMSKLFSRAFAPLPEEAEQDQRLSEKMSILQKFIRPEHLDISESFQNETSWLLAQKELQKINTYKAPRDKLVCILNCCRVINNLLLNVSMANKDNPPGADDFLPVLIYVVIKANPPQLHSNLLYIQRYRHQNRLVSEASYFYTNLVSAESFIANLDSTSLSMDPADFEGKMEAGRRELDAMNLVASTLAENEKTASAREKSIAKEKAAKTKDATRGASSTDSDLILLGKGGRQNDPKGQPVSSTEELGSQEGINTKPLSVEKMEAEAFGQVLEADKSGQLAKDYPFLYASAGDLRVVDVESLLHEYKELVLKYVALRKAVESFATADKPQVPSPAANRHESDVDPQESASTSESLAQILTRPEDMAELLTDDNSNVHPESGLESEHQELESRGLGTADSLREESDEQSLAEDPERLTEETEVPQDAASPVEDSTQKSTETESRLEPSDMIT